MRCAVCQEVIWNSEYHIVWGGFTYCGTSCVVDELKREDGLEEKNSEDN